MCIRRGGRGSGSSRFLFRHYTVREKGSRSFKGRGSSGLADLARMMRIFGDVNIEQSYTNPEDAPYDGHHPSRTREPIKYSISKTDFVKQATSERAETHSESLTHHEKASERRSSTDTDDSSVGAITLAIHPHCEPKAIDDTADQDKV